MVALTIADDCWDSAVLATINLNHDAVTQAQEIDNEIVDRCLTAKVEIVQGT